MTTSRVLVERAGPGRSLAPFRQVERLLALLARNPYATPPSFEKLLGDLSGACSRRINLQHRLVSQVLEEARTVRVLRMWTHYE